MPIQFDLAKYLNPIFVETGTYKGHGIAAALASGFPKIYSIEVSQEFYEHSVQRFKSEIAQGTVEILLGDSLSCLAEVIQTIDRPITFWLDAHETLGYQGKKSCPLYEELDAIANHPIKNHTILIDDLRLLSKQGWGESVVKDDIIEKLKQINHNYSLSYENGKIENDVLVALPDTLLAVGADLK
ncbi:hypothetical protein BJP36_18375 [Moorena producens JHB]|uniref:Methyltransferase n=1 Tax=Moorena producens (strain JHB) TaxID=1454205 RepID=A0A1D9G1T9_MOOP1|nr:hypothetical protein [Moorena producens]AOY81589.1 hypothetical protein BJP36_18375 [Moorena producens JHB]